MSIIYLYIIYIYYILHLLTIPGSEPPDHYHCQDLVKDYWSIHMTFQFANSRKLLWRMRWYFTVLPIKSSCKKSYVAPSHLAIYSKPSIGMFQLNPNLKCKSAWDGLRVVMNVLTWRFSGVSAALEPILCGFAANVQLRLLILGDSPAAAALLLLAADSLWRLWVSSLSTFLNSRKLLEDSENERHIVLNNFQNSKSRARINVHIYHQPGSSKWPFQPRVRGHLSPKRHNWKSMFTWKPLTTSLVLHWFITTS